MFKAIQNFFAPYVQSRFDTQLKLLEERLEPLEKLMVVTAGNSDLGSIVLYAATDRRVIRFAKSWQGEDLKYVPYNSVHFVDENRNFRAYVITVAFGNGGIMRISPSSHPLFARKTERFVAEMRARILTRKKKVAAPKVEVKQDVPDQIKKLGELKKAKLISEKEFETKKKELLGRL